MRLTSSDIIATCAFAAMAAGCTKPRLHPRQEASGHVDPPSFSTEDPLTEGVEQGFSLTGGGLIFAPLPPVSGVRDLLATTANVRDAKDKYLAFQHDKLQPAQAAVADATAALKTAEAQASNPGDPRQRTAQLDVAKKWFDGRLEQLKAANALPNHDATVAVWEGYCDAKIWELAASSLVMGANAKFFARPTPLGLCEGYYERAGFFTSENCKPDPHGKSYAACLWHDGVMRTRFFAGKYEGGFTSRPNEKKSDKIAQWVDDGTLASALTGTDGIKIRNAFMTQARTWSSALGSAYHDAFVPDQGTPDAVPDKIIGYVESGATNAPKPLLLVDTEGLSADATKAVGDLHQDLADFGQRSTPEAVTVSDFLFDQPITATAEPRELSVAHDRATLSAIFDAIPAEKLAEINARKADLTNARDQLAPIKDAADQDFQKLVDAMKASADAASEPGISDSLWSTARMTINKVGEGIFALAFSLDHQPNGDMAIVCWNESSHAQVSCPDDTLKSSADGLNLLPTDTIVVSHDPATTLLRFEVTLADPEAFGFQLAPPRQELDPLTLRGATLRLDLYPNRMPEGMRYYSGKLQILRAGQVIRDGAINLMAD